VKSGYDPAQVQLACAAAVRRRPRPKNRREEYPLPEKERRDLVTSLVRQWITYDGHATLFVGGQQVYLILGKTPLGRPRFVPETDRLDWEHQLTERWHIAAQDLPDVFAQLNRGQSAEVTNAEGVPLRLWVNPKEKGRGVESLARPSVSAVRKRDYHRLALAALEPHFAPDLEADELEALACSVARQWERYDGHACVFLEEGHLLLRITELDGGNCLVDREQRTGTIEPLLHELGVPPEAVPAVIVRFNLGQEVEFQDRQGVRQRLWNDPKARQVCMQAVDAEEPRLPGVEEPLFCPKCGAVLGPWPEGDQPRCCHHCGQVV
jgi:hypothetical protein